MQSCFYPARRHHGNADAQLETILKDDKLRTLARGIRKSRLISCVSGSVVGERTEQKHRWALEVANALHKTTSMETARLRSEKSRRLKKAPHNKESLEGDNDDKQELPAPGEHNKKAAAQPQLPEPCVEQDEIATAPTQTPTDNAQAAKVGLRIT